MKLKTEIGKIALEIEGNPIATKNDELISLGLKYLIFHKMPALAFKKGSGFLRSDDYSEGKEAAVKTATAACLAPYFNGLSIASSLAIATTNKVDAAVSEARRKLYEDSKEFIPADKLAEMYPEFTEKLESTDSSEELAA